MDPELRALLTDPASRARLAARPTQTGEPLLVVAERALQEATPAQQHAWLITLLWVLCS